MSLPCICARCGKAFTPGYDVEEARAAYARTFPTMAAKSAREPICAECLRNFLRWYARQGGELR